MQQRNIPDNQSGTSRRKKRTQLQIFKEVYLPALIACTAVILIVIFIIGSITRSIQRNKYEQQVSIAASEASRAAKEKLENEAQELAVAAAILAERYDYEGALAIIESFSGNYVEFPMLDERHRMYTQSLNEMVLWDDPSQVLNLSFHLLIADPERAFADAELGSNYSSNFVTVTEFQAILQQLYKNGYILIDADDLTNTNTSGLYLPAGKKPLILTQTNVNYYNYMIGNNDNYVPDASGAGFASKLILDANGNITCELVTSTGETVTGAYDMVPILESFLQTHPDFSYRGARAVLAVSGYDGIFGYRINHSAVNVESPRLTAAQYEQEVAGAKEICSKLLDLGYDIACYTYSNTAYGTKTAAEIEQDLQQWRNEIEPILGKTNILVFAKNSDISTENTPYSGEKFAVLNNFGFTYYIGFCESTNKWCIQEGNYTRQGRILITGDNLTNHSELFAGMFDATSVLDPARKEGATP